MRGLVVPRQELRWRPCSAATFAGSHASRNTICKSRLCRSSLGVWRRCLACMFSNYSIPWLRGGFMKTKNRKELNMAGSAVLWCRTANPPGDKSSLEDLYPLAVPGLKLHLPLSPPLQPALPTHPKPSMWYIIISPALPPNSSKSSRISVFRPFQCYSCISSPAPAPAQTMMSDKAMGDKLVENKVMKDKLAGGKVLRDTVMGDKVMWNKSCNQDGRIHGAGKGNYGKQRQIRDKVKRDQLVKERWWEIIWREGKMIGRKIMRDKRVGKNDGKQDGGN